MYLSIITLPLLSALFCLFFGRFLGFRGAAILATTCVFFSAILSLITFYEVGLCGCPCYISLAPWFYSEMFDARWGFLYDSLTVVMLVVVTSISSLVHLYSISYMSGDPHLPRFMAYLSIFTFFMLLLVTADNFIQMFLGWEGVGLASYLLINFWFTRVQANKAAIKAMLMNRIGDFGLALGIMGIFYIFKTVDYATVFASISEYNDSLLSGIGSTNIMLENSLRLGDLALLDRLDAHSANGMQSPGILLGQPDQLRLAQFPHVAFYNIDVDPINTICILLFIGAVGKSAQLGLHTWLPDAMEGPTPVSALIHAATMVTAGVFLISRCSPLFENAPGALIVVTFVGAMTSLFAATTGLVQNDLKRVIAYSTCSQLGYMIFACGLSHYSVGIFHLANHAFFKALLFLSAGSVIHAMSDEQDMRKLGGVVQLIPFTYAMMVIGSLSLAGFPYLTGFYSKDLILEIAQAKYAVHGQFAFWIGAFCVALTSYYSFRLLFLTFLTPTTAFKQTIKNVHDAPPIMAIPLILLAIGSILVGYFTKDMMVGVGTNFWGNSLYTLPASTLFIESEYIPQTYKLLPLVATLIGAVVAFLIAFRPEITYSLYGGDLAKLELRNHSGGLPLNAQSMGHPTKTRISRFGGSRFARSIDLKWNNIPLHLYYFFNKRWLFDKVYNDFGFGLLHFAYQTTFKTIDKGILELLGPLGIIKTINLFLVRIRKLQSGFVYHYAVIMLLALTFIIALESLSMYFFVMDLRLFGLWLICASIFAV